MDSVLWDSSVADSADDVGAEEYIGERGGCHSSSRTSLKTGLPSMSAYFIYSSEVRVICTVRDFPRTLSAFLTNLPPEVAMSSEWRPDP